MPITATVPDVSPITFQVDTGTLRLGNQEIVGFASRDMVETTLQERITELEGELQRLRSVFTADFARELVGRYEQFVNNQELTGMTDEEFETEIIKRHALTIPGQEAFVDFVAKSSVYGRWLNLFTVLLGTGMRIGECLGLRWEDCDFDNRIINVNHNLIYRASENGHMELHITTPKTKSGTRIIPMLKDVKSAILSERPYQMEHGFTLTKVDGYSGFIFQNSSHEVLNSHMVNRVIARVIRNHNKDAEKTWKLLLPHFSAHNLRHTFCTRLCENEQNSKIIQEIMGHRNIKTTMDIYNEATKEKKLESFSRLDGKIKIV